MRDVSIIGVDLAKNVFQAHGAAADGSVVFRKKLSRPQFSRFMADHPPCLVAMGACASAHHWAREMARHGHEVRLIAPHYVKPFIKRQKNDAADAEAIVEAALRPTMRFVEPKSAEQQARAVAFRTREPLVKQRTEAVNALRSHLYEFGHVAPVGIGYVPRLERVIADPDADIPELARDICRMLLEQIAQLTDRIDALKTRIAAMSREADGVDGSCSTGVAMRHIAGVVVCFERSHPMKVTTVGLDLAKNICQVHGITAEGEVVFNKPLRRAQLLAFFGRLEPCLIGIEACSSGHCWARELSKLGHQVRLIPPIYVKPYVKRGKSDAIDAEAICEAVTRPTMRFVEVKTEDQQALLSLHRTRDLVVRQRTQLVNMLRGLLAEFGIVIPQGLANAVNFAKSTVEGHELTCQKSVRT